MKTRTLSWFFLVGASSLFGACGKSEGDSDPIARDQLPTAVANVVCDGKAGCCQAEGFPFDAAACKAEIALQIDAFYDPAKVIYDAAAAGECVAEAQRRAKCGELDSDGIEACDRVFQGLVGEGQPCAFSGECKREPGQSVSCSSNDLGTTSVCTVYGGGVNQPRGKAGEACNGTCNDAEGGSCGDIAVSPGGPNPPATPLVTCYRSDGLYCAYSQPNFTSVCAPVVSAGGSCGDGDSCGNGSVCDYATRLCTLPRPNGQPCESDELCQSSWCSDLQQCATRSVTADECAMTGF